MSLRWTALLLCGAITLTSVVVTVLSMVWFANVSVTAWLFLVCAATAIILLFSSLGLGYAVVQPLRRRLYDLEEGALLIASGRLQHRVPMMGDSDEIGRLTEQFNQMGEQIEQQVRVLQRLAEENTELAKEAEQAATLNERQRLARELHDSVSQQLFALTMLSGAALRQHASQAPALSKTLDQLSELANAAQREMRALLLQLRPVELEGRSLEEAIRAFLGAVQERHQLQCVLEYTVVRPLGTHIEEQVFRIIQEAVANVLKHAEASELRVVCGMERHLLQIRVLDNGKGILDSFRLKSTDGSYGFQAMKERASHLGGRCDIVPREKGTAVEVRIPVLEQGGIG